MDWIGYPHNALVGAWNVKCSLGEEVSLRAIVVPVQMVPEDTETRRTELLDHVGDESRVS